MRICALSVLALASLQLPSRAVCQEDAIVAPHPTPGAPPAATGSTVTIYEVSDLVRATLPKPAADERSSPPESDSAREAALAENRRSFAEENEHLAELIRSFVEPKLEEGQAITSSGTGVLIVEGSPAQQAWIQTLIALHRSRTTHLDVRTWYLEAPRGAFRGHLPEGSAVVLPTEAEREAFLALAEEPEIELLATPRVLARDRERATLDVMTQIPYVADWQLVVVEPGAKEIADPRVEIVNEGYSLDVRTLTLPGGAIGVDLGLTRSFVERPIPTRTIRLSASLDREVEIASPTSHSTSIRSKLVLAPGASVVFLAPANDAERDLAVVVSASVVSAPIEGTQGR